MTGAAKIPGLGGLKTIPPDGAGNPDEGIGGPEMTGAAKIPGLGGLKTIPRDPEGLFIFLDIIGPIGAGWDFSLKSSSSKPCNDDCTCKTHFSPSGDSNMPVSYLIRGMHCDEERSTYS